MFILKFSTYIKVVLHYYFEQISPETNYILQKYFGFFPYFIDAPKLKPLNLGTDLRT